MQLSMTEQRKVFEARLFDDAIDVAHHAMFDVLRATTNKTKREIDIDSLDAGRRLANGLELRL